MAPIVIHKISTSLEGVYEQQYQRLSHWALYHADNYRGGDGSESSGGIGDTTDFIHSMLNAHDIELQQQSAEKLKILVSQLVYRKKN